MQWEEIARQLNMDSAHLAKLALCRLPRPRPSGQRSEQIAAYLGVEKTGLLHFFKPNLQPANSKPGLLDKVRTKMNTTAPKRYIFALAVIAVVFLVGAVIAFSAEPPTATLAVTPDR